MTLEEMSRGWKPPAGLGYSSLRPVRLTAGGYALVVLAVVIIAGSAILCLFLWNKAQLESVHRERLAREGMVTEGSVVRLWRDGDKEQTPWVSYRFQIDGVPLEGASSVPSATYRTLHPGDTLPIRYVPGSPKINHPALWRMNVTPAWIALLIPAIFWGVAGLLISVIRRQWRLLAEGRATPGVVVKTRKADKGGTIVTYEFRLLSGAIQRGRTNQRSRPSEGAPLCVLYDPENPRRSGIYPFPLVRPD